MERKKQQAGRFPERGQSMMMTLWEQVGRDRHLARRHFPFLQRRLRSACLVVVLPCLLAPRSPLLRI